jgi:adenosine kinase
MFLVYGFFEKRRNPWRKALYYEIITVMDAKVLVVGSLAFDVIFSIPHDFRQSIPLEDGRIRNFNASFVADGKKEFPGGTAGNIAYWLGTQHVSSAVFSAFGKDFWEKRYEQKLKKIGCTVRGNIGDHTAHAYLISDPLHQQLIIWQPNAYAINELQDLLDFYREEELKNFQCAIFAAGTPKSITKHLSEFRAHNPNATVIFDPGQMTPLFEKEGYWECCKKSDILIGNDIEFIHFKKWGIPEHITEIETRGELGVRLKKDGEEKNYPAEKVENVVETTGAGDAFRAGFIAGITKGHSFDEAIDLGTRLGARCTRLPSGQEE